VSARATGQRYFLGFLAVNPIYALPLPCDLVRAHVGTFSCSALINGNVMPTGTAERNR
jgi:hypothetical protein